MSLIQLAFSEDEQLLNLLADQAPPDLFSHPQLQEIWKIIRTKLGFQRAGKGGVTYKVTDVEHYFLERIHIKNDGTQDALAAIIDKARNAYNRFVRKIFTK